MLPACLTGVPPAAADARARSVKYNLPMSEMHAPVLGEYILHIGGCASALLGACWLPAFAAPAQPNGCCRLSEVAPLCSEKWLPQQCWKAVLAVGKCCIM